MRRHFLFLLSFLILSLSAKAGTVATRDVFSNVDQTRHPAQGSEFYLGLYVGGCGGCMLTPTIGLSAGHCHDVQPTIQSGVALRDGTGPDGRITRTIEWQSPDSGFDYWIFEVSWNGGGLPAGQRLVPEIQTSQAELQIGDNATSDRIYTLGFPGDVSNGTQLFYSWGYPKSPGTDKIITNNISLINGNSGGCIMRESDNLLVSIVSGGPHALGDSGWNGADWNDSSHWNQGPALWQLYPSSSTFKNVFPNGKNRYL